MQAEFINKNADNLSEPPLKKFFDALEHEVNQSRDMTSFQTKIKAQGIDSCEDQIYEVFFTQEYQIQTIHTDEFHYIGTVNKFGKPEGIGRMVFPNNGFYEGSFKNGRATGYGRKIDVNGSIFNGLYFQDIRQGRGVLVDKKGTELKGNWWHYTFEGEIKRPEIKNDADA